MARTYRNRSTAKYNRTEAADKRKARNTKMWSDLGGTCRCPICGSNNAGKPGAKSFAGFADGVGWRDESGRGDFGRDRKRERRNRRRVENRNWKEAI